MDSYQQPRPNGDSPVRTIYVASSWRNQLQPTVIESLRSQGHRVYDFKHPTNNGARGFHWDDVSLALSNPVDGDPWVANVADAADYVTVLDHPVAVDGFERDFAAMLSADTCVLVLPCGRSAHLELGWAVGAGKRTAILLDDPCTPELMYRLVDKIVTSLDELIDWLAAPGDELTRVIPPGHTPEQLLNELLRHQSLNRQLFGANHELDDGPRAPARRSHLP